MVFGIWWEYGFAPQASGLIPISEFHILLCHGWEWRESGFAPKALGPECPWVPKKPISLANTQLGAAIGLKKIGLFGIIGTVVHFLDF